jgi:anti-anti-sigma regulatory factor
MIRIHVEDQPTTITLYVEGKLAGESIDELRRVWTSVRCSTPDKQTVVDLSSVRAVDCDARKLLCQMHGWGTRLSGTGLMIGPLIAEICKQGDCEG